MASVFDSHSSGKIITFYSYKGGTGRSMALANIAWILASNGYKVLTIDWDLEAPGLHRYFRPFLIDNNLNSSEGIIDFVWEAAMEKMTSSKSTTVKDVNIQDYIVGLDWDFSEGQLDFIPAGRQSGKYSERVNLFDWDGFYQRQGGGALLADMKNTLAREYDYILIDSRTGVSDTSGICTMQLPDALVACFTLNNQSIDGVDAVLNAVQQQRGEGRPIDLYPVATRIEFAEKEKLENARTKARRKLNRYLVNSQINGSREYWDQAEVTYQPYYAYEEILAVFGDRSDDAKSNLSMLAAMEKLASLITGKAGLHGLEIDEMERLEILKLYSNEPGSDVSVVFSLRKRGFFLKLVDKIWVYKWYWIVFALNLFIVVYSYSIITREKEVSLETSYLNREIDFLKEVNSELNIRNKNLENLKSEQQELKSLLNKIERLSIPAELK